MKRTPLLVSVCSLTLVAASAGREPGPYTFLTVASGDTVASEVVQRAPTTVAGDLIHLSDGKRYRFTIHLGPDGRAESIRSSTYRLAEPGAEPFQNVEVTFHGDSAEVHFRGRVNGSLKVATRPGAVPFIEPSGIALEQVLRQARDVGGQTDTVPVFDMLNGRTGPAIVRWTAADSAEVTFGNIEVHAKLSDDGFVLGYAAPSQGAHVIRVEGAHPLALPGAGG